MFSVKMSKFGQLYRRYDSRVHGNSVSLAGPGGAGTSGQAIIFVDSISERFLYGTIILLTGPNAGAGSEIISDNWNGSSFSSVILNDSFDFPIEENELFVLLAKNNAEPGVPAAINDSIVSSVSFGGSVVVGHVNASVGLVGYGIPKDLQEYLGHDIQIFDKYNDLVWQGLITEITAGAMGADISAVGYGDTFSRYHYYNLYPAADPGVSIVTILADIINTNPFLVYSAVWLDRGDVIHAAQAGTLPVFDFTESPVLASEAISSVLAMGATPLTLNPVYLQVFNHRIPKLTIVDLNPQEPKWVIRSHNLTDGANSFILESSLSSMRNTVFGAYTDADGVSFTTNKTYDLDLYERFGPKEQLLNASRLGQAEIFSAQSLLLASKSKMYSPSRMSVTGYVALYQSSVALPCWKIMPGDVVAVMPDANGIAQSKNRFNEGELYVVGETSYDSESGAMDLWVYQSPDLIQSYINSIDIGV